MARISRPRLKPAGTRRRVVVLGGGFAGVWTARELERQLDPGRHEILLIARNNFFVMSPLLFEAGSGVLEFRHAVTPLRELLSWGRYYQGTVEGFRPDHNAVIVRSATGRPYEIAYDQLVVALGGVTNRELIPGSEHAIAFKVLGDAILLRNRVIDLLERAETEFDPEARRRLLSIVVIGGGLVGTELVGELTEMLGKMRLDYPSIRAGGVAIHLVEFGPRPLREMEEDLAKYATAVLRGRGVSVRVSTKVEAIGPDAVRLGDGTVIPAGLVVLASGTASNPVLRGSGFELSPRGHIMTDATMRAKGRENVWAVGDCAHIPDADGNPYPPLAQHAVRMGPVAARNVAAALTGRGAIRPFRYRSLGTLAALGHYAGVAQTPFLKATGFPAWWIWRTYYLFQTPRWSRRIRIMIDWTFALFFKPDTFKIDLGGRTPGSPPVPE